MKINMFVGLIVLWTLWY